MTPIEYPFWVWALFFGVVLTALFVDVGIVNRKSHIPTRKETFAWSAVWISLSVSFGMFVYWMFGAFKAKEFFTGYLIELSLSIDNLFVFLLIFSFFGIPRKYQHRVLFWGIIGALFMRMIMIFAGAELVERFHWIIYIFGAFLVFTGIKMFSPSDENFEPHESLIVKLATKYIRISKHYDGDKFFVTVDGVRSGTLMLLVLITVEFSDLIFAIDSIPAIFGITTDRFIVYTSNIFAILGLRTFFFLLADMAEKFHLLKYGLAFVLTFIGAKMLLPLVGQVVLWMAGDGATGGTIDFVRRFVNHEFAQETINISLAVVGLGIFLSIIFSLLMPPKEKPAEGLESEAE